MPGCNDQVICGDSSVWVGVDEVHTRGLHANDGDAVLFKHLGLGDGEPLCFLGWAHLDDGEAVFDLNVIHEFAGHQVGYSVASIELWKYYVVHSNALEDPAVLG